MGISGVKMNKDSIISGIKEKGPVIAHVANYLGCDRNTIYAWMARDNDVLEAMEKSREQFELIRHDLHSEMQHKAYQSALALLAQMDVPTTIFILKTLCGLEQKESGVNYSLNNKGSMDERK